MNRRFLTIFFVIVFCVILYFTILASFVRNVFDNGALMSDPWFRATLADAYLAFLTFYVWVAWKEKTLLSRVIWFVLIMCFGNLAMASYVLIQLWKLKPGEPVEHLLLKS